jgi:hypothetical protein
MIWFVLQRIKALQNLPAVINDYRVLKNQLKKSKDFKITKRFPILSDRTEQSAVFSEFYFYQDLYIAQRIFKNKPEKHVDIWSRIDGFVAHVATFREIELLDIRPFDKPISNVIFKQADLMELQKNMEDYTDSISSLSVIEHFGLGRYGDKIDKDWHLKGLKSIHKILKKWWKFYFSVPIGTQGIEFNAHRIFSMEYLLKIFKDDYEIEQFSYVDDHWVFHENIQLTEKNIENNMNCKFWNGIFELIKK